MTRALSFYLVGAITIISVATFLLPPASRPTAALPTALSSSLRGFQDRLIGPVNSHPPCDPYRLPGYLDTQEPFQDSRYILPGPTLDGDGGEGLTVPSYSSIIKSGRAGELGWLRNRSVLLVGDSIDRNHVIHLGRRVFEGSGGQHDWLAARGVPHPALEAHRIGIARLPELNFRVYNWFLMGTMVNEKKPWFHPHEDPPQPFEDRLDAFFLPTLPLVNGPPDLVIINGGGLWDLDYLATSRSRTAFNGTQIPRGAPLSAHELSMHRQRLRKLVRRLKAELSSRGKETKFMYRSLQLGNATAENAFSHVRIQTLDQSSRRVMEDEGVPVLEWGKMTIGLDDQLSDPPVHYGIGSAQYIFGDMVLFHLRQQLVPARDEWEGCTEVRHRIRALSML